MGKNPMRDALKSFYFILKVSTRKTLKGIFFLFYQIAMKTLFYERIYVKNLYELQFRWFRDENIV